VNKRAPIRRLIFRLIAVVLVLGAAFVAWRVVDRDAEPSAADVTSSPDLVARGEYLTRAADCAACHNAPGGKPYAGGVAFKLPFGTIYSTNITADKDTGIGTWSDDDFVRALHAGIGKDGKHLYPAFPYTSYTGMSREDAVAIKAYLFSLPAVNAPDRANDLAFPFNQRWAMAAWNIAFLQQHRFRADPALTSEQNRGAYLATALGHCGECHTPRNLGYGLKSGDQFAGELVQGWRAYNITSDKQFGVGDWSDKQLSDYLSSGHADGHGSASGPMAEAVENSLQYLKPEDTSALISYLRIVKPQSGTPGTEINAAPAAMVASTEGLPDPHEASDSLGRRVFERTCTGCHQWNGKGLQTAYAALGGSQTVNDPKGVNLTQILLHGVKSTPRNETVFMPEFGAGYTDAELAAVSNYVIAHFGGKTGQVTPEDIHQRRMD
jgi:mono/diheme cytochrome c family protein